MIKVGGGVIESDVRLSAFLDRVSAIGDDVIVVHGGGRTATAVAAKLGVETVMVEGRRVTSRQMLDVVTMVYGGLLNKRIVSGLEYRGRHSVGLSGADLGVIRSERRSAEKVDFGFVGDVCGVDAKALSLLISQGYTPVCAPLTYEEATGMLLNTNADTIASEVASAMGGEYDVTLEFDFEHAGVLSDPEDESSVIRVVRCGDIEQLAEQGIIGGGMIPKLNNARSALQRGVGHVFIAGTEIVL